MPREVNDLTVYGQSCGLLYQFILAELLAALPDVSLVEKIYSDVEEHITEGTPSNQMACQLAALTQVITSLCGSALEESQSFPWTASKGSLGKLRQYCQAYHPTNKEASGLVADLQTLVSDAFHALLRAREVVTRLRRPIDKMRTSVDITELTQLLSRFSYNMHQVAEILLSLIACHGRDENVLYYLLRNIDELHNLYHDGLVREVFLTLFDDDLEQARNFIQSQYQARGFEHISAKLSEQFAKL